MSRPDVAYLVSAGERAEQRVQGVFADRADAHAFAEHYNRDPAHRGRDAEVRPVDWWPAGAWRHRGVLVVDGQALGHVVNLPPGFTVHAGVDDAQLSHTRVSRRCAGAGIDIDHAPSGLTKYHCTRCRSRIY